MLIAVIALVIGAALYVMNMVGVNINANVICSLGVLIVGFAMLIKGADLFVEGASKIAAKFKIPQIVIGLTIVAMGTSAPEAAISISAAFQDAAAISIGNVVGSNIMNILLILGVSAVITNLKIKPNTLKFEIPFVVFITAVLLLLGWIGGGLDKIDGVIMLVLFAAFLGYLFYLYKKGDAAAYRKGQDTCSDTYHSYRTCEHRTRKRPYGCVRKEHSAGNRSGRQDYLADRCCIRHIAA